MTLFLDDGDVRLYHGDAVEQLAKLPAGLAQTCVTSPPFWGLRDYGVDGQIGLEESPEEWCERLVAVFVEVWRVLRDDGTLWLEVGDSYAAKARGSDEGWDKSRLTNPGSQQKAQAASMRSTGERHRGKRSGLKEKDLVGAPWMLAFALRADGWYLRSDIVWARPNPMPESVHDRPTKAHSYVFLLTKQPRYFYDADAIREPHSPDGRKVTAHPGPGEHSIQARSNGDRWPGSGHNARTVWTIPTQPTPFAHFATFPQALVERCVKAGTSEHGQCPACGAPWKRETERSIENPGNRSGNGKRERTDLVRGLSERRETRVETTGWQPSCTCPAGEPVPQVVLDPFMGSGTTALVARRLGRHAIGTELSAEYLGIAARRLQQLSILAGEATA